MPSLPRISPDNYWTSSHSGMMTTARSRGLPLSFNNDRHLRTHELLTIIKLDDAWQGLLPQPQLQDASRWSGLDAASLLDEAQKYGYFQGKHKRLREMQQERAKADEQRRAEPDYKEDDMPDWYDTLRSRSLLH